MPYIHVSEFKSEMISDPEKTFVVVTIKDFDGLAQLEITNYFHKYNINNIYALSKYEKEQMLGGLFIYDHGRVHYYKSHINELETTFNMLSDDKSKEIMLEYIRAYIECGVYSLEQGDGRIKYFYAGRDLNNKEELYTHLDDEVWINCGANKGDNIFLFFDNGLKCKKIYAYEGVDKCFDALRVSLSYLPDEYRKKIVPIKEYIAEGTSFDEYIDDAVTLVNADLDGSEMEMLQGMAEIIKKDRPVIAICVYHKPEDLVVIPQYINDLVEDYEFVLRKYEAAVRSTFRCSELVLYAIPKDRYLL